MISLEVKASKIELFKNSEGFLRKLERDIPSQTHLLGNNFQKKLALHWQPLLDRALFVFLVVCVPACVCVFCSGNRKWAALVCLGPI